jgi:hypothetical protein
MKKLLAWCKSLLSDEKGQASSKRFVGIICAFSLCITMYHNSFSDQAIAPSTPLVESVALLAFGCLGLSSIDKFTLRKTKQDEPQQPID